MKFLFFSDLHAHNYAQFSHRLPSGRNSRLQNCLNVIYSARNTAENTSCDAVFFLGDVFHSRYHVDVDVLTSVFDLFAELAKVTKVFMLVGNHDQYTRVGEIHATKIFSTIPNLRVVDYPTVIELGPRIAMYPHTSDVEGMKAWIPNNGADLLLFHQGIKEAKVGPYDMHVKAEIGIQDLCLDKFKLSIAGDFHKRQFLAQGKFHYVGSPLQLSFSEIGEDKAFSLVDTDDWSVRAISTDAPRFFRFGSREELQTSYYDEEFDSDNDFIRVTTEIALEVEQIKVEFPRAQVELATTEQQSAQRISAQTVGNDRTLLAEYVEQQAPVLDRAMLTSAGLSLLGGEFDAD